MSPYHTCRSFAIYLSITLIITESPISAFTIRRTRTTTLKPFSDPTAEASALVEVRYRLPKNNNVKADVVKDLPNNNIGTKLPTRSFSNILEVDNKSTINNYNVGTTTVEFLNEYETTNTEKYLKATTNKILDVKNTDYNKISSVTEENKYINNGSSKIKIENTKKEQKTTHSQTFTTETLPSSSLVNFKSPGFTGDDEFLLSRSDVTNADLKSITDTNDQKETMAGEASSSPSWKTYTTIERKRTTVMSEAPSVTTEQVELLTKSETVTSRVTIEPQSVTNNVDTSSLPYSEQTDNSSSPPESKQLSYTLSTIPDKTISHTSLGYVSSKRAGFLDLTAKQTAPENSSVGSSDKVILNETVLNGSIFDINEGMESKKPTGVESQSQLVEDAIKEELLKEQMLSDNFRKPFEEDKSSIKPTETNDPITEDSLSVKPISLKGNLYTVSPHYKPMKKIEVQPLKPFLRDPDDNSWRNESLSLLGIVFKAKNASKPFTQVLKNKTEAELSNMNEKDDKNEVSDLRERLEKIAEVRKSRKKKVNKFGDTVYSDYEEITSSENVTTQKPEAVLLPLFDSDEKSAFADHAPATSSFSAKPRETTTPGVYMYKEETTTTTKKPKKVNKFLEYYDTTDEYDADYITLAKLDLKKFTTRLYNKETLTTPTTLLTSFTKLPKYNYLPERKPTIQYFPPRPQTQKVNINDYDHDFQKKVNLYTSKEPSKEVSHTALSTAPTTPQRSRPTQQYITHETEAPVEYSRRHKPNNLDKTHYVTYPSQIVESVNRYPTHNDETFNRASYVIKHYKDLIDEAVKDDYDKNGDFVPAPAFTVPPLSGVTVNELTKGKFKTSMDDDYDYVANFRKDILNRFVDNFNQNSERFKVDFPILYNNSVVHMKADDNGKVVASSSAFLKRLYESHPVGMHPPARQYAKACEHCDIKVELSPDYELHYYVPDQEEKEELEPEPATLPYTYRL